MQPQNNIVSVASQLGMLGLTPERATILLYEIQQLNEQFTALAIGKVIGAVQSAHEAKNTEIVALVTALTGQGGGPFGTGLSQATVKKIVEAVKGNQIVQPTHAHQVPVPLTGYTQFSTDGLDVVPAPAPAQA